MSCCALCVAGTVPVPESLLHSGLPSKLLEPITTAELMSVNPVILDDLKKKCKGSMQCVHDILATNNTKMGLHSLANEEKYHNLALIFGEQATSGSFWAAQIPLHLT